MSIDAKVAVNGAHAADNTEARDIKIFLSIVALVLVIGIAVTAVFGLGGLGVVAIAMTVAMLLICIMLTKG
jgi:hypothetical protein